MEGCECFILYEEDDAEGTRIYLDTPGQMEKVSLKMVRRVLKEDCIREAMAGWVIMLIVAGVVSGTGAFIAVAYKRMRLVHRQRGGRPELCQHYDY